MRSCITWITVFLAAVCFIACGGEHGAGGADEQGEHHEGDGHDHSDHSEHDDHEEHGDDGERVELDEKRVGPYRVTVAVFGHIEAGEEAVVDVLVDGGASSAVRAWVGIESGRGSLKSKVDGKDGVFHGHIEVPTALPAGSAIWVEVEALDGSRSRASFDFP